MHNSEKIRNPNKRYENNCKVKNWKQSMNKSYITQRKGTHFKRKETSQNFFTYFLVARNKLKSNIFYFLVIETQQKMACFRQLRTSQKKLLYKFCHQSILLVRVCKIILATFFILQTFLRPWTVVINILCHLKAGLGIRSLDFRANHLIFWAKEQIISESLTSPFFKERQERIALLL